MSDTKQLISAGIKNGWIKAAVARPSTESDYSRRQIGDKLTTREQEVLSLICRGLTNSEIAIEFDCGSRTIETHRQRINQKLIGRDCNAVKVFRRAVELGLIPCPCRRDIPDDDRITRALNLLAEFEKLTASFNASTSQPLNSSTQP